jgi:hypothetical protein
MVAYVANVLKYILFSTRLRTLRTFVEASIFRHLDLASSWASVKLQ